MPKLILKKPKGEKVADGVTPMATERGGLEREAAVQPGESRPGRGEDQSFSPGQLPSPRCFYLGRLQEPSRPAKEKQFNLRARLLPTTQQRCHASVQDLPSVPTLSIRAEAAQGSRGDEGKQKEQKKRFPAPPGRRFPVQGRASEWAEGSLGLD